MQLGMIYLYSWKLEEGGTIKNRWLESGRRGHWIVLGFGVLLKPELILTRVQTLPENSSADLFRYEFIMNSSANLFRSFVCICP